MINQYKIPWFQTTNQNQNYRLDLSNGFKRHVGIAPVESWITTKLCHDSGAPSCELVEFRPSNYRDIHPTPKSKASYKPTDQLVLPTKSWYIMR